MQKSISGFSKLSKRGKLRWMVENFFKDPELVMNELKSYWLRDEEQQKILDGFSENTISNYHLPFSVSPNWLINGTTYCVPMVIEESSVVAAASSAAKYWQSRGGFKAEVLGIEKLGQIHFTFEGREEDLRNKLPDLETSLRKDAAELTANMEKRGGGVQRIELKKLVGGPQHCYTLVVFFHTADSMGANFINSVLEVMAESLRTYAEDHQELQKGNLTVLMAILSNLTPDCLVRVSVEAPISQLACPGNQISPDEFAQRFYLAVAIAKADPYRATTHNKGIFNGVDAVVIATGNDFRAVEACGHAYAARDGQYRSLSNCSIDGGVFRFWMDLPLALGTVGGLTTLHPMARRSLELLDNPSATSLMQIAGSVGLAQNFAALRSLVTIGIQQGHMRMHLSNILSRLEATEKEIKEALVHFADRAVSHTAVQEFLQLVRSRTKIEGDLRV